MHEVTNAYKEGIYAPIRKCVGRVTFDISDLTANTDISSIDTSTEFTLSNKQQIIDKVRSQQYKLATNEINRFKLDGSFIFADDTVSNNGEMGYCSSEMCGEDRVFKNYPTITFKFNNIHSCAGITITWDVLENEYAKEYTVTAYNSNDEIIDTVNITDNNQVQSIPMGQLYKFTKLVITVKKWSKPYRMARVCQVDFGLVKIYEDSGLMSMSLVEELDLTSGQLPLPQFKFTVDNLDKLFNILNPTGIYKYLQKRQQVIGEIGLCLDDKFEYIKLGEYMLNDWSSDEGSITATFTAGTKLDLMANVEYENLTAKSNYSLYDMATELFLLCGVGNYTIDSSLQSVPTLGLIKKTNCKNILQMICIAAKCNLFVTRDNVITIKPCPTTLENPVDNIDMDNMFTVPKIKLDDVIKSVEVTYFSDMNTRYTVTVNDPIVDIGSVLKVENNTLINTETQATEVATWILNQRKYRAIYSADWRGNMALEPMDIVKIEDGFKQNNNAILTKINLEYAGYLKGKAELRGVTSIVD